MEIRYRRDGHDRLDAGFRVNILTKSALVERDFDLLAGAPGVELGMTLTTLHERLRALRVRDIAVVRGLGDRLQVVFDHS